MWPGSLSVVIKQPRDTSAKMESFDLNAFHKPGDPYQNNPQDYGS